MKQKMFLLLQYIGCILFLLLLSGLYGDWVRYVRYACGVALGCFCITWLVLYVHGKREGFLFLLVALLFSTPSFSSIAECEGKKGAELEGCIFDSRCSDNQSELCRWSTSLDPESNELDPEVVEYVTLAGWLVGAYDGLDETYKTHQCSTSLSSGDCYCCARVLDGKYHTWLVRHGGTGDSNIRTVPQILASQISKCWPCDIVLIFLIIMEHVIINAAPLLATIAINLLYLGMLFWIVFRIMKLTLDLATAKTLWQDILKRTFFVMCGAMILWNLSSTGRFRGSMLHGLFRQLVIPSMELLVGMNERLEMVQGFSYNTFFRNNQTRIEEAMERYGATGYSDSYCGDNAVSIIESRADFFFDDLGEGVAGFDTSTYLVSDQGNNDEFGESGRIFSSELIKGILCTTQRIYNGIAPMTAMGSVIVSSQAPEFEKLFSWRIIFAYVIDTPSLIPLFYGLLLYIPCVLFSGLIGFEMLDIFLRMLFVFPLTPLWIVCAVFPLTRKYAITTCKFLFSLLVDFLGLTVGLFIVLGMTEQFLPDDFVENITCWMFDTRRESDSITCNLNEVLSQNFFISSNKYYAEHLYRELTKEHGYRVIAVVFCMLFLGRKVLFSIRSAFRDLLKANTGVDLGGGSITGSALMDAQRSTREGIGLTVGMIPFVGQIGTFISEGGGKLTDSAASAGNKFYNKAANAVASGINRVGDASSNAIKAGGAAVGTGGMAFGDATMAAGKGLCSTGLGAIIGIPLFLVGGAIKGGSWALKTVAPAAAALAKVTSRIASVAVKATKVVARVAIEVPKRAIKAVGKGASTATKRFFYMDGNEKPKK